MQGKNLIRFFSYNGRIRYIGVSTVLQLSFITDYVVHMTEGTIPPTEHR